MLKLEKIEKKYDAFHLKDISFSMEEGDYFVLLGESGAGKSIILEIIAGMVNPDKGDIYYDDEDVLKKRVQDRKFGLVFQDYAVFPHMNVFENIAFPIQKTKKKNEIKRIVLTLSEKLNIKHLLKRDTKTLSGGELQRVALARTLALEPKLLLLDEPLSALDIKLRDDLRNILRKLNNEGVSMIHVTHDFHEAIALANKIGIIHNGRIIQVGTPKEVFHRPKSEFVARFTGIKNFYSAKIIATDKALIENKLEVTIPTAKYPDQVYLFFRAEDVVLSADAFQSSLTNQFKGKVIDLIPCANGVEVICDIGIIVSVFITQKSSDKMQLSVNSVVWLSFKATALKFIHDFHN